MDRLVLDYLEKTARKYPDKIAFADVNGSISFEQLVNKARCIGTFLSQKVKQETIIPFFMDKSITTIIGFFGAVYAGCAYSQINLRYPAGKIHSIIDKIQPPLIVTNTENFGKLKEITNVEILVIEDLLEYNFINHNEINIRRDSLLETSPLYVNFTSGSTGDPKGVIVSHKNVISFISEFIDCFSITDSDVIANQAPFDFDVSVKDIYSGVFTGARVEIIPTEFFIQPKKLGDFLYERDATILIWAVSALCFVTTMKVFEYKTPEHIRAIMFSGEVMPIKHLKKLQRILPEIMYVNLYGPTEITCNCTYYIVDRQFEDNERLPIGKAFKNGRVFLLDENNNLVTETNGIGELCVSGSSVTIGYLRNDEKTKESFCQNPLNTAWFERIYRTGDLIRISDNREMIYLSRKDYQIKHMGHRIELTEIDGVLQAINGIDRACCIYNDEKKRIIAFICGINDLEIINRIMKEQLPEYMIPNVYINIDHMPMNKNGKIDRQSLMNMMKE